MADNKGKAAYESPFILRKRRKANNNEAVIKITVLKDGKKVSEEFEHKTPAKEVFKEYRDLSEISNSIARDFSSNAYEDADVSKLEWTDIRDKGLLFFMSSDAGLKRTGLLSLLPAILTGIRLYSKIAESETNTKTNADALEKIKDELLSKIRKGIEAVFKFIYRDEDWRMDSNRKPVFDASPYESDAFYAGSDKDGLNGRSYIGTISWAIILFLKIMYLVDDKDNKKFVFGEYREEAKKLIEWCLSYVNGAVLTYEAEDKETKEKDEKEAKDDEAKEKIKDKNYKYRRPVGWNFSMIDESTFQEETKKKEPKKEETQRALSSLFFTYEAASMYLAIFEEYEKIIDNLQTLNRVYDKYKDQKGKFPLKKEDEEGKVLPEEEYYINNFKQAEDAIDIYAKTLTPEEKEQEENDYDSDLNKLKRALAVLKDTAQCPKHKIEDYYFFNDKKSAQYNGKIYDVEELNKKDKKESLGPISRLKWNLEKISEDFWGKAKYLLEDNFIYDDFNFNIATPEAIQSGGQTNALFAGLLFINICLYSKYDFVIFYTEDKDGSGRTGEKAFNDMQNTMLLHVQRVQRFFDKLSEKNKEFGVNSLILRLPATFSDEVNAEGNLTDREVAEQLRKQLIKITSLTPMLLKTNNLISQFIVRYPQKQMGEAIDMIGQKRFYDRKKDKYYWFWESDGYHAMSNYYYVGAIFDFYKYYDDYEKEFIIRYADLRKILVKDLDYTESVQAYYQKKAVEDEKFKKEYEKKHEDKLKKLQEELEKAKKSEIGEKLFSDIKEVVKNTVDEPEFLKGIINGLRKQLAVEVFKKYSAPDFQQDENDLKKLKEPIKPNDDGSIFSLLQALAADIILQSAIESKKDSTGRVSELGGGNGFDNLKLSRAVYYGSEQLINGLLNELFATMCHQTVSFNKPHKNN